MAEEKRKPTAESIAPEHAKKLTDAVRLAAKAQIMLWDVLREIGEAHGCDWEPTDCCAIEVAGELASGLDTEEQADEISIATALEVFTQNPDDWQNLEKEAN
jgi:hypothetical protein